MIDLQIFFLGLSLVPSSIEVLALIAISPTVFLMWFFYHSDRYKRESPRLMGYTFLIGALTVVPAIVIELLLGNLIPVGNGLVSIFIYYLFGVALVEEALKFFSVRVYSYRSPSFDEPMDGLVLGVAAALGFATIENILYVLRFGLITGLVRAFVSVPEHALNGAIIGFYLGEGKFHRKAFLGFVGLIIATFLHGVFDTVATVFSNILGLVVLVIFVAVVYFQVVRKEITKAENESPRGGR